VEAHSIEDVQEVVQNVDMYPSPVRAVGAVLSPSCIHQNDGGTILHMHKLNKIYGIVDLAVGPKTGTVKCLKAQAGATFADVNEFLHKRGLEMAFSAEIGSATVGGTCFATTKDSSIGPVCPSGGLGDFQSCVMGIETVGPDGAIKKCLLFDQDTGAMNTEFQTLLSSQGTQGVAVAVYISARENVPVTTTLSILKFENKGRDNELLAQQLQDLYENTRPAQGNIFALIGMQTGFAYVEERRPGGEMDFCSAPLGFLARPFIHRIKKFSFQRCLVPQFFLLGQPLSGSRFLKMHEPYRRRGFRYTKDVPITDKRLTFSYYSFDYDNFQKVVQGGLAFTQQYNATHGFMPKGFAIYFVTRSGHRVAGPYAGEAGTSFSFDPIYDNPSDKRFYDYVEAFTLWAHEMGGKPGLNQTPQIEKTPQIGASCVSGSPHPRFTSNWIQTFYDAK